MILYAESSAVLSWLMGEASGEAVRGELMRAEIIIASQLTVVECHRVISRALHAQRLDVSQAADLRRHLSNAVTSWTRLPVDDEVLERAGAPFPAEPLRTLDALHIASAIVGRHALRELKLLSLDHRVRAAGGALGFDVLPK